MAYEPKVWTARNVQFKNRFILVPTGNTNEFDRTRSEGIIYAAGDEVSTENMNNLESRIKAGIDAAGSQFTVLGHYDTLSALQSAHPTGNAGDAYFIGTALPYNVYFWDTVSSAWKNLGQIQGPIGPAGSAATISVGTVTTGAAGSSATVTNIGSSSAAIFDFSIPQGAQGVQGIQGATGPQGPAGIDGTSFTLLGRYDTLSALQAAHPTGNEGDAYAVGTAESNTIYNWDINTSAWVDIGDLQGPQGVAGTAATIAVGTVTTGAAGSSATVTNSGTSSAAVFDFSIPQGAKGDKGDTGESINVYTCTKTGTVFDLKGTGADGKFLAPADYVKNDTFRVNPTDQLFNHTTAVAGYIDTTDGTVKTSAVGNYSSPLIIINSSTDYKIAGHTYTQPAATVGIAWYNSAGTFISGTSYGSATGNGTYTSPATAYYVRYTVNTADLTVSIFELNSSSNTDVTYTPATPAQLQNGDSLPDGFFKSGATIPFIYDSVNGKLNFIGGNAKSGSYPELTTGTELQPNTKYDFGEVTSLTLTLATPASGESNEYLFCFKSGATATTLSLPAGVKWVNGSAPTIATNKSYVVSILYANSEYLAAAGEF